MTDLLDTIDNSLQEVEEQLLAEFKRIRGTLSDRPFESIDVGIRNSLSSVLDELRHMLEHSGDKLDLQLMTERHENLFARIAVIRQLFNIRIPTAFLHEVHNDVKNKRRKLEAEVAARRSKKDTDSDKGGLFDSIRGMFGSTETEKAQNRNRFRITEQEERELAPVEIYLDNGIYSASRELAMLATRVNDAIERGELKDYESPQKPPPVVHGKAHFESRDLSRQAPPARDTPRQALTPEEIRKKLAARTSTSQGASKFEARDVSSTQGNPSVPSSSRAYTSPDANAARGANHESEQQAQTPEEIRRKLATRQSAGSAGRATFGARDIDPVLPSDSLNKESDVKKTESGQPESNTAPAKPGKAVFEVRELTKTDPKKR